MRGPMRNAFLYLFIFMAGGVITWGLLRTFARTEESREEHARRNALALLERPPSPANIPETPLVTAAAKIEPAVVNIDTLAERTFRGIDLFGQPQTRSILTQGKGSGVIITPDGYIVTNSHVIEGAAIIRVTMVDGRKYQGRVVGSDPAVDLAVVKIDARDLPAAELGDSDKLKVGEYVLAIGYPLGFGTTVTHGIVSATDRRNLEVAEGRVLRQAIQTDAPINRGNSGGALANMKGQLVGINTAIASQGGGGNIGIGFAIPINAARNVIKDLIAKGRTGNAQPSEPFIGIVGTELGPDRAVELGLPSAQGVVVVEVYPLSPAESAGLKRGDIIVAIDGKAITSMEELRTAVRTHRFGEQVRLRLMRGDGSTEEVKVTVGARPQAPSP